MPSQNWWHRWPDRTSRTRRLERNDGDLGNCGSPRIRRAYSKLPETAGNHVRGNEQESSALCSLGAWPIATGSPRLVHRTCSSPTRDLRGSPPRFRRSGISQGSSPVRSPAIIGRKIGRFAKFPTREGYFTAEVPQGLSKRRYKPRQVHGHLGRVPAGVRSRMQDAATDAAGKRVLSISGDGRDDRASGDCVSLKFG